MDGKCLPAGITGNNLGSPSCRRQQYIFFIGFGKEVYDDRYDGGFTGTRITLEYK